MQWLAGALVTVAHLVNGVNGQDGNTTAPVRLTLLPISLQELESEVPLLTKISIVSFRMLHIRMQHHLILPPDRAPAWPFHLLTIPHHGAPALAIGPMPMRERGLS